MRPIKIQTFMSLDGVMQAPGGPDEDTSGGFTLGGWSQPYWDDMMGEVMGRAMSEEYDLLLGRKTYDIFAAHWPNAGDDNPVTQKFNKATKYVATSSSAALDWENSQAITDDVAKGVAELKRGDGLPLSVQGSSQLIQTLLENLLADELFIWTFPVVLGSGKRLFGGGAIPQGFELADTQTSTTGVTMARYRAAGDVKVGSFALKE
ncbi:dihydrofolate reductase [Litoreibacter meonggei]|uniref:Dihydrofolate reductase n=1 Tax=Litoreibacter meonggei TaxID=1049199 RepID=A0A497VQM2_9RHOB|nr:dihydrofolate reductase family protein [Litoreibacter meonggei]RLJ41326.1 dihydrofolate reductase [Litoreibacter meonggei]